MASTVPGPCVREMVHAFTLVNIEDDIYVQSDRANTSTELVYDEFFECLVRMFQMRYAKEHPGSRLKRMLDTGGDDGLDLACKLDEWLGKTFLVNAFAAIKAKKKANK